MHVFYGMLGFAIGNWYPKAEKQLLLDINEIRADRGLPPLVGSNSVIRYPQRPEGEVPPAWNNLNPRAPEEYPKWRY